MPTALTQERLLELLNYNPGTGVFTWRVDRRGGSHRGDVAGAVYSDGYRRMRVDIHKYSAHRLAWLYMTGVWPAAHIDHKDGIRDNNRFDNLREATHHENQQNRTSALNRTPGLLGTRFRKGGWEAAITSAEVCHYLGRFATTEEANAAYLKAKSELHKFNPSAPHQTNSGAKK